MTNMEVSSERSTILKLVLPSRRARALLLGSTSNMEYVAQSVVRKHKEELYEYELLIDNTCS